jgi:PGF-pre-PGF domain-containing protein
MRWTEFKIAFVLLLALALCAAPASAGSAERVLPQSVDPGEVFRVTVNVADYGAAGQFLEELPEGFTFVGSTLPEKAVTVNGNRVSFLLMSEQSFGYILKAPASAGTYKFVGLLRDINKADFSVLPADSSINVRAPSSSGSYGSSGGSSASSSGGSSGSSGAGGSPEPQNNIEAKELSQEFITNGQHVKFEFPKGTTCIRYVEFDAKKALGKITTIVEMLKGQSKLVSSLPSGTVYKNVNIWVGTGGIASSDNIEKAVIGFRVEKAWLEKNGANASSLNLWYYDNVWSKLDTQKIGEDDTYVYFEAKTLGFGHLVIVVKNEKTDLKPSDSKEIVTITPTNSGANATSEPEKPSSKTTSFMPGFESAVTMSILGAVYCVLRKKL